MEVFENEHMNIYIVCKKKLAHYAFVDLKQIPVFILHFISLPPWKSCLKPSLDRGELIDCGIVETPRSSKVDVIDAAVNTSQNHSIDAQNAFPTTTVLCKFHI
jgi:hypothetical protein